jgi:mRNA-degrading endonuclease RelE of RelBE toxin-antitoxin system
LRFLILVQILALCCIAFGDDQPALCELATTSIVSRSSTGLAQVSNLGDIEIECRVAARPFPSRPGESRNGLTAATEAYLISSDATKTLVASEVLVHGGGGGGFKAETDQQEYVDFLVHIPLEPEERDSEARRYLAKLGKDVPQLQLSEEDRQKAIERIGESVYQQRVGHFRLSCHVLDGDRTIGVGVIEIEVLLKGRFSDVGLPGAPPA